MRWLEILSKQLFPNKPNKSEFHNCDYLVSSNQDILMQLRYVKPLDLWGEKHIKVWETHGAPSKQIYQRELTAVLKSQQSIY